MTPCSVLLPSYVSSHFTPSDQLNAQFIWSYTSFKVSVRLFFSFFENFFFLGFDPASLPFLVNKGFGPLCAFNQAQRADFPPQAFQMIKYLLLTLTTEATYGNISSQWPSCNLTLASYKSRLCPLVIWVYILLLTQSWLQSMERGGVLRPTRKDKETISFP